MGQENSKSSAARLFWFWHDGGKILLAVLVLMTVFGAGSYAKAVHVAVACLYGERFGIGEGMHQGFPFFFPIMLIVGSVLIHLCFRNLLIEGDEERIFQPGSSGLEIDASGKVKKVTVGSQAD